MGLLSGATVIQILQKALNLVDYRLVDHGERVAYIMLNMLSVMDHVKEIPQEEMFNICLLALLHDIGAFKTEEIDTLMDSRNLMAFETHNVENHCAFGYLYLNHFLPSEGREEMVLYHHMPYAFLKKVNSNAKELASMLFLADRYDLLLQMNKHDAALGSFQKYAGSVFSPNAVKLLEKVQNGYDIRDRVKSGIYQQELYDFAAAISLDSDVVAEICKMLVFSIDFRSPVTVTHTVAVVSFSRELGVSFGLDGEQLSKLHLGSMLHDLGKIATPIEILEKPGKLTPYEFEIMRDHVVLTEKTLQNCLSDEVVRIAARHHERMDGSGYPHGLRKENLTLSERILAVADMASALLGQRSYKNAMPPAQVREILAQEVRAGRLCPQVTGRLLEEFDGILPRVEKHCNEIMQNYSEIGQQFPRYVQMLRGISSEEENSPV